MPSAPSASTALHPTLHAASLTAAIDAGKHVYSEKPVAATPEEVLALARHADAAGVKHGVVADKLYLPGIRKLKRLLDGGFFGRVLSVRGEFGYWVFEGDWQAAQRPSWNYRAEDGGGIVVDMFCHWSYLLEGLLGPVEAVTARAVTHIPTRWDENGAPYAATADDAAYAIFELAGGVVAQVNSSWATRVNRDELVEFHVDGTHGSAVAGLRNCKVQSRAITPKPVWDPGSLRVSGYEIIPLARLGHERRPLGERRRAIRRSRPGRCWNGRFACRPRFGGA